MSFVVAVSDRLFPLILSSISGDRVDLRTLESQIQYLIPYQRVQVGNIEVWRLQSPAFDEQSTASRRILAQSFKSFKSAGRFEIRDVAELYHSASPETSALSASLVALAQQSTHTYETVRNSLHDDETYQLVGAISDEEWNRLLRGQTLTGGELGIQDELKSFLMREAQLRTSGEHVTDYESLPIEALRDGVTSNTSIRLTSQATQMIKHHLDGLGPGTVWETFSDFQRGISLKSNDFSWDGEIPRVAITQEEYERRISVEKYQLGFRQDIEVTIGLGGGLTTSFELFGAVGEPGEPLTYADFPRAFRDAAWTRACEKGLEIEIHNRNLARNRDSFELAGGTASGRIDP